LQALAWLWRRKRDKAYVFAKLKDCWINKACIVLIHLVGFHLTSTHILGMKHRAEMCERQPSRPI
jgi:hypothetical protein